jgi:hypothetical protein
MGAYDSFYGDDTSGDGSSQLYSSIINAVGNLGTAAIQASHPPNVNTTFPYRPPTIGNVNPLTGQPTVFGSGSSGLLFLAVIAIAAVFILKK